MLEPKQTKYSKYQKKLLKKKRGKPSLIEWRSNKLKFGTCGLQAMEQGLIKANQIEAVRQVIRRKLKREGQLWIRIFPSTSLTKKPIESRMGKGKGNIALWAVPIKAGQILYEIAGVSDSFGATALKFGGGKLPVKTKIIFNKYR